MPSSYVTSTVPNMTTATPRQLLVRALTGRDALDLTAELKAGGASWDRVAEQVNEQTGGQVALTGEAIRQWHAAPVKAAS